MSHEHEELRLSVLALRTIRSTFPNANTPPSALERLERAASAVVDSHAIPSTIDEKMRQSLRQIACRCTRQEKDRAITEREQILAWLDAVYLGQVSSDIRRLIAQGAHLPGGKLPPKDPKAMLTCKTAGVPPSMRCPSCKAYHGLGLDAETGEAEIKRGESTTETQPKPTTPKRAG